MALQNPARSAQALSAVRQQAVALAGAPKVDVLVAELLLEELGELGEAVGVGEEGVEAALPGGHTAAYDGHLLLLLALQGEAVQALAVAGTRQRVVFLLLGRKNNDLYHGRRNYKDTKP